MTGEQGPPRGAVALSGQLAAVALGSSLGPSRRAFRLAVAMLAATAGIHDLRPSRIYLTAPAGGVARRPFLNACVRMRTTLSPGELLARCRQIELRLGRRPTRRWADRALDLDVLLYGEERIDSSALVLPHPRMHDRPFQLLPLLDCWPDVPGPWRSLADAMSPLPIVGVLPRVRAPGLSDDEHRLCGMPDDPIAD